jgi:hypothetical protein
MHHDPDSSEAPLARARVAARVGSASRSDLRDWLELHGLTCAHCEDVLSWIGPGRAEHAGPVDRGCGQSADEAWDLAAHAMLLTYPWADALIRDVRDRTLRSFGTDRATGFRPFTAPGTDRYPVVSLAYRGRIVDLITVAHEFGHAVQMVARDNRFVPPIARELAAFLSELALLDLLARADPAMHRAARAVWLACERNYLVRDADRLASALKDPASPYRYCWNYPIARVLASGCAAHLPAATRWSLFEDGIPLAGLVRFLACDHRARTRCGGACLRLGIDTDPALPAQ